jgi:hypothetical protein
LREPGIAKHPGRFVGVLHRPEASDSAVHD